MQPHQKKGSVKPFNIYLESLKPQPKLTEKELELKKKIFLSKTEKYKRILRARYGSKWVE